MAKQFSYEIYQRSEKQHRPGHFGLLIEGMDADLTIEPSQFMAKAFRELLAAGKPADPIEGMKICEAYARVALERRIDNLRMGKVIEGVDIGKRRGGKGAISGGTASEMATRKRGSEERAVEVYLNRGRLSGMTKDDRKARMARLATFNDNDADWRARRAKLIAECENEIKYWEEEHVKKNPKADRNLRLLRERLRGLTPMVVNATHGFQYAYTQYLTAVINLASDDIRIWPLMTNTTLDTVRDAVDQFSDVTADEFDGANYSSGGLALDSQAVAVDDANDRAEFDAADEAVTALGAGTRSIQGVALGKFNTNTAGSLPLHWLEFSSNKTPDGSDFTFVFNAEGILQAADG